MCIGMKTPRILERSDLKRMARARGIVLMWLAWRRSLRIEIWWIILTWTAFVVNNYYDGVRELQVIHFIS